MKKIALTVLVCAMFAVAWADTITITITSEQATLIEDSMALNYGYRAEMEDEEGELVPNTVTKPEFSRGIIEKFLLDNVISARVKGLEAQRVSLVSDAEADMLGVVVTTSAAIE